MSVKDTAATAAEGIAREGPATPDTAPTLEQKRREKALDERAGDHAKLRRAADADTELGVLDRVFGRLDALEAYGEQVADDNFDDDTRLGRAAQSGTVLTVVTLGITILVGILIYSQIQSSLPSPSNNELQNASQNATGTFADAMELAPVIMIVLLAAVVLAVVQRFR